VRSFSHYIYARIKIDGIAERILSLRYHPMSNYSKCMEASSIQESTISLSDREMVTKVLNAHSLLLMQMSRVTEKDQLDAGCLGQGEIGTKNCPCKKLLGSPARKWRNE
jgi:DNA-binding ferritin-like protein